MLFYAHILRQMLFYAHTKTPNNDLRRLFFDAVIILYVVPSN